ncbi:glycosyltransferase [Nocardioides albidus]|uniref:Glycosyltransferase n=1 Tax=Nocardioides albidus TaxID=1517589 RepID=A0A5C4WJC0_9ACTN|nr:glycosyltransferase [Nocardioides albidus]TNM48221.1 glycosyltransferase [Nocardioides albidus]
MESCAERIGTRLIKAGLIEPAQLEWALEQQRLHGGYVGHHLISAGFVSSDDFHDELARAWNLRRRDLVADPPQADLLEELDVEEAVELGWLACEVGVDGIVVASCVRPNEDVVEEVLERFPGMDIEFVACSRSDIDSVALGVRRRRLAVERESAAPLVRPVHVVLAVLGAALSVAAGLVMPFDLLAVLVLVGCAAFLAGCVAQSALGYAALLQGGVAGAPVLAPYAGAGGTAEDQELPLYSIIVRVCGGRAGVAELIENASAVDYPRDRTDVILVVADGDTATLEALRATSRRGWVRVARVPDRDFVDVVRACDHGLALARGRYVVAYDQDEQPARDQLRRAVAVFEADLAARIDGRLVADPLVGLRVAHRAGPHWPTVFDRLREVDEVLPVDGSWSDRRGPVRSPDVTSVHFNMRLLRRRGGFGLLVWGPGPVSPGERIPRIESLDSTSVRATDATARRWLHQRADRLAQILLDAVRRGREMARRGGERPHGEAEALLARAGAVAMFLAYPIVLGGGGLALLRTRRLDGSVPLHAASIGLGMAAIVLGVVVLVVASLLARRGGPRAALSALALPAHWLLHALAAWTAVWALVVRRPRRGQLNGAS